MTGGLAYQAGPRGLSAKRMQEKVHNDMAATQRLYRALTAEADRNDPVAARRFAVHLVSLCASKIADGLIDPKLVLAWILGALGAPGYLVGALVPVREAGALLPQLALAQRIQASRRRKLYWAVGSAVQGLAALGIAAAAILLEGAAAGWAILGLLAILATARAACSASYKDVLARTVTKGSRGTVSGTAGTVAAAAVFGFALAVSFGVIPLRPGAIAAAVAVAGALWLLAAAVFARLDEPADPEADGLETRLSDLVAPLRADGELRQYLAARMLLISTALAPPFLVLLSNRQSEGGLGNIGYLILASSAAAILSAYVWGRASDRSSRRTLMAAGALAAVALGTGAGLGFANGGIASGWLAAGVLFVAQIAYEGARAGRKTHLTDMDTGGRTAVYTALSNTVVGVMLLAGGLFGVLADLAGPEWVLAVFAALAAAAVPVALGLSEVQREA